MKTLLLGLCFIFPVLSFAESDISTLEYDLRNFFTETDKRINFVPTDEMRNTVAAIKNPTERMLNHTFWHITTLDEINELIQSVDLNAEADMFNAGLRILNFAMFSGKSEFVWAVLNAAPSTDYISTSGSEGIREDYTPLMLAAIYYPNDLAMLKRIVSLGCDPDKYTSTDPSMTVLSYAETYGKASPEVCKYLLSIISPTLRLHSATFWETATPENIKQEIQNGANINHIMVTGNGYNITPLWYALLYCKNYDSIQTLIDMGGEQLRKQHNNDPSQWFIYEGLYILKEQRSDYEKILNILKKNGLIVA